MRLEEDLCLITNPKTYWLKNLKPEKIKIIKEVSIFNME